MPETVTSDDIPLTRIDGDYTGTLGLDDGRLVVQTDDGPQPTAIGNEDDESVRGQAELRYAKTPHANTTTTLRLQDGELVTETGETVTLVEEPDQQ